MSDIWERINKLSETSNLVLKPQTDKPTSNKPQTSKTAPKKNQKTDCKNTSFTICQAGVKVLIHDLQTLGIYTKLINHFTISVPQINYIKKVHNHKIKSDHIIFPRFGMLKYLESNMVNYKLFNAIKSGDKPSIPFKWTGVFKHNQKLIADKMDKIFSADNINKGMGGAIINLEAGQGKSYLAAGLMQNINQRTLVVCHTISILNQWIELLKKGYPNNKITSYSGEGREYGDIVVGIINSLLLDTLYTEGPVKPREFFKSFGFVIFDEIHLYSSNARKQIYYKCQSQYMLGLSATPDENKDGLDKINIWNCGDILNATDIPGYSITDIQFNGEVLAVKYYGHPDYTQIILNETTDIINHSKMVNNLCDDPYRLYVVIKYIFELRNNNKNLFVFADRRSYLDTIKSELEKYGIATHQMLSDDDKNKIISIMGGSSSENMNHAKNVCNIILTTYQYAGTGLSIGRMDALILATPRKTKSKQYIGRIFRIGSNYDSVRKIIDIIDYTTHMKSQYYLRKKYYDEKKYPITKINIKWQEIREEMKKINLEFIKLNPVENFYNSRDKNNASDTSLSDSINNLKNLLDSA
jgi:superfamily II DNA or RNA helicase